MNLVDGKVITHDECESILSTLSERIQLTLANPQLDPYLVVDACNALSLSINAEEHEQALIDLKIPAQFIKEYLSDAKTMLSKEYLLNKISAELGSDFGKCIRREPDFYDRDITEQILPLGVLLHIAAGNMEGLPVFTVIEGLLTGNINILKLPAEEGGISVRILQELFKIEPSLTEYVYVFDYSSKDIQAMQQLADLADAIIIWGGNTAIQSVRAMAKPNTKIIEWGHKMSFAYVSGQDISDEDLRGIAVNICHTNQLLCSSCQGIFIDTESIDEVYQFCVRFLPILENVCREYPSEPGIGIEAQVSLRLRNEQLEAVFNDTKVFIGENCSITAYADTALTTSIMFRNTWVRKLPRSYIIKTLRPYKNYLQTVGLICDQKDINELSNTFWKTGVVRITDGYHMSKMYNGSAHDGEYPLRRYTKTVALELSEHANYK